MSSGKWRWRMGMVVLKEMVVVEMVWVVVIYCSSNVLYSRYKNGKEFFR